MWGLKQILQKTVGCHNKYTERTSASKLWYWSVYFKAQLCENLQPLLSLMFSACSGRLFLDYFCMFSCSWFCSLLFLRPLLPSRLRFLLSFLPLSVLSFIPLSFSPRSFSCHSFTLPHPLVTHPPPPFLLFDYQRVISSFYISCLHISLFHSISSFKKWKNSSFSVIIKSFFHPFFHLCLSSIFPSSVEVQWCFVMLPFSALHPSPAPSSVVLPVPNPF